MTNGDVVLGCGSGGFSTDVVLRTRHEGRHIVESKDGKCVVLSATLSYAEAPRSERPWGLSPRLRSRAWRDALGWLGGYFSRDGRCCEDCGARKEEVVMVHNQYGWFCSEQHYLNYWNSLQI